MNVAVLGAGAWGTALAAIAGDLGHSVRLWGRDPRQMEVFAESRENKRYLPGRVLAPTVRLMLDFDAALQGAEVVILAVPTSAVRAVAMALRSRVDPGTVVLCAAKGFEQDSHLTLDRVLADVVPDASIGLLSGPTFAAEIARGMPAAVVAASADARAAAVAQMALGSESFRVYTSFDVIGVAVGGALKNVIAIAAGCADGLGLGTNARAALITRGLNEIARLATRLGGEAATLAGLAGLGDLVLTCTGDLSRNRRVGLALAAGDSLAAITDRLGSVAEGVPTAHAAAALAAELGVEMPITQQVAEILAGRQTPRGAVRALLLRDLRPEA